MNRHHSSSANVADQYVVVGPRSPSLAFGLAFLRRGNLISLHRNSVSDSCVASGCPECLYCDSVAWDVE